MTPTPADVSGRRRRAYQVGAVVSLLGAAFCAVIVAVSVTFIADAASGYDYNGNPRSADIAAGAVFLVAMVVLFLLGVHFEHRLRQRGPVGAVFESARAHRRPIRQGRYGPLSVSFQVLVCCVIGVLMIVASVGAHAGADRSQRVQHDGVASTGTVVVDRVYSSQGRYRTYYSSLVTVTLSPPVDGAAQTVVHIPSRTDLQPGEPLEVLVDPHDPSYAEEDGIPFVRSSSWLATLVFGILFSAIGVSRICELLVLLRQRRAVVSR